MRPRNDSICITSTYQQQCPILRFNVKHHYNQYFLNKSAFSYLCTLTLWLLAFAAAADQYVLTIGPTAANLQRAHDGTDRWTDGWTLYHFLDLALHTTWAVPIATSYDAQSDAA